jgi:hypothetical protein
MSGQSYTVVTTQNFQGWKLAISNTAQGTFDSGQPWPFAQFGGMGSFRMTTGSGDGAGLGGKAFFGPSKLNGVLLSDITSLSYSTYTSKDGFMPYLNLYVDLGNGSGDLLAFDPPYFPPGEQAVVAGRWQEWQVTGPFKSWRCIAGKTPVDMAGTLCTPNMAYTWEQLTKFNPMARVAITPCSEIPFGDPTCAKPDPNAPGLVWAVGQKSGGTWKDYVGNVDNVKVEVAGFPVAWNFEP